MASHPISTVTPSPKAKPCIYIDLTKADIAEIKGLEVDQEVKVTIRGKVQSISMRSDDAGKTASISVESNDVTVREQKGKMADLLDEEEDE
jgi:hypothetical protein